MDDLAEHPQLAGLVARVPLLRAEARAVQVAPLAPRGARVWTHPFFPSATSVLTPSTLAGGIPGIVGAAFAYFTRGAYPRATSVAPGLTALVGLEGAGRMKLHGSERVLGRGDLLVFPTGVERELIVDGDEDYVALAVVFDPTPVRTLTGEASVAKELAKRLVWEVYGAGITSRLGELCTPEVANEILPTVALLHGAMPDLTLDIGWLLGDATRASCLWRMTGTQLGRYRVVPPTKASVTFAGSTFVSVDNARISAVTTIWDEVALLRRLRSVLG